MYRDHSGELIPIMSPCAWSCQRPPRSRARSSRTSSQSCSESTSTPSRSNTTAAMSDGVVTMLAVDERLAEVSFLDGHDLADEDRVIAGVVAFPEAAFHPTQSPCEQRHAGLAVSDRDVVPQHERRHAPSEVRGNVGLVAAQDRDAKGLGRAQELVQRHVAPDGDADERRLERQRDKRPDRRRHAPALDVRADDADARREAAHQPPQVVAARHRANASQTNACTSSATPATTRMPAIASFSFLSGRRPVRRAPISAPGTDAADPTAKSVQSTPPGRCPTTPAAPTKKPTVRFVPIAAASGSPIRSIAGSRNEPRISPTKPPSRPIPPPMRTVSVCVIRRGGPGSRRRSRSPAISNRNTPIVTRNAFFGTFPPT